MEPVGPGRYDVLEKTQVLKKMTKKIDHISEVFSLSRSDATVVLILLKWNSEKASNLSSDLKRELISCFNQDYVAPVGPDLIGKLPESVREMFESITLESFMEANKDTIKWCPAPGCSYAIELKETNKENFDVGCSCGHFFCWRCQLESHRPVTCEIASVCCNNLLNQARSLSEILENFCPLCKNLVQKNDDADYRVVTCIYCSYRFCSVCKGEEHIGIKNCNAVAGNSPTECTQMYFLKIWDEGDKALRKDLSRLRILAEMVPKLGSLTEPDIIAFREAAMLIMQCRQVLKWISIFRHFKSEYQMAKKRHVMQQLRQACNILGNHDKTLHEVMKEAQEDNSALLQPTDIHSYMRKLETSTSSTRKYFHGLVKYLENGMPGVKDEPFMNDYWLCGRCKFQNAVVDKVDMRSFIETKVCMRCFLPQDTPPGVVSANNDNSASVPDCRSQ